MAHTANKIEFTRKMRLENECNHSEYYAQFVTEYILHFVESHFGKQKIADALAADKHLNSIPLAEWDMLTKHMGPSDLSKQMRSLGDYPTLSALVCILKEAARQIAVSE